MKDSPPKIFLRLFKWICDREIHANVEGDLLELFHENKKKKGTKKAKRLFVWEVLRLFRPGIIKSLEGNNRLNYYGLFKHNVLITFRRLRMDRLYSILNLLGLALGAAAFILLFQYVQFENSYDQFHVNSANMYRVNYEYLTDGGTKGSIAGSPPRVVSFMKEKLPEVKSYTRVNGNDAGEFTIILGDSKFRERNGLFVDANFLEFFSFPLIYGDINSCLSDKYAMIMTESTAKKYFGDENPVGKIVTIDEITEPFTITGVVKDVPLNSHIQFDILATNELLNSLWGGQIESWYRLGFHGFILLEPDINIDTLKTKFDKVFNRERGEANGNFTQKFSFQPISNLHFNNNFQFELNPEKQGDKQTTKFLLIIGYLILVIAWINYVNLSTARAINRGKEVGVRKTLGANRNQLIAQFILESLIMNLMAGVLALLIVFLGSNFFYGLTGVGLTWSHLLGLSIWKHLLSIWMLGSILAGLYPAFVLSSFKPSSVLKSSSFTVGSKGWLRRLLVVFQFAASIALIAGTVILYRQLNYMKNKDIGFETNNVMVIRGPTRQDHNRAFIDELSTHSEVLDATLASRIPGENTRGSDILYLKNRTNDDEIFADWSMIGYDYFSTLGIKLLEGRTFNPDFGTDSLGAVLNEEAVRLLGFDTLSHILGKTLILSDGELPRTVIGVVANVNHLSSKYVVKPLIMVLGDYAEYYVIKYKNDYQSMMSTAKNLFQRIYPFDAFEVFFLDEFYDKQYRDEDRLSNLITLFSGLAIFIACLGLFGLASHNTLKRTKEIGIRKVLGASVKSILMLLSREFVLLVVLANIVTWPVVYYFMKDWLDNFAFRINIGLPVFLFSGLIVLILAFLTVTSITTKVARANPTDALRNE